MGEGRGQAACGEAARAGLQPLHSAGARMRLPQRPALNVAPAVHAAPRCAALQVLLELVGLVAAGQFALKLLFAEEREQTLTEIRCL